MIYGGFAIRRMWMEVAGLLPSKTSSSGQEVDMLMTMEGGRVALSQQWWALLSDVGANPCFDTCATSRKLLTFLSLKFFIGKIG